MKKLCVCALSAVIGMLLIQIMPVSAASKTGMGKTTNKINKAGYNLWGGYDSPEEAASAALKAMLDEDSELVTIYYGSDVKEEDAEKLKLQYGNALYEEEEDTEAPAVCTLDDGRTIELSLLNNIIGARAEEILANVWNQLQLSGYEDKLFSGVVFTGGGSNLKNLEEAFRKLSKVEKIKTVKFVHNTIHGYTDTLKKDGMQNTLLGLLAAGNENCCLQETAKPAQQPAAATEPKNMFENDATLIEQEAAARAAKALREKEEKERKERERKEREQREKEEKKRKKREGPSWFERTFDKFSKEIFSDDDMK